MIRSLTALAMLVVALAGCQQSPEHRPQGEDPPPESRQNKERDQIAQDVALARGLSTGKMPRADNPAEQQILVSITYLDLADAHLQRLSFQAAYDDGDVRAAAGRSFRDNGFQVALVSGNLALGASGDQRSAKNVSRTEQFITVLNGREGFIQMGQLTPRERVLYRTPRGEVVAIETVATGATLVVVPEILDPVKETIGLRIWPELSGLRADGGVELTRIETTVVIQNGQTIMLGGATTGERSIGREWFSKTVGGSVRQQVVLLKVSY